MIFEIKEEELIDIISSIKFLKKEIQTLEKGTDLPKKLLIPSMTKKLNEERIKLAKLLESS